MDKDSKTLLSQTRAELEESACGVERCRSCFEIPSAPTSSPGPQSLRITADPFLPRLNHFRGARGQKYHLPHVVAFGVNCLATRELTFTRFVNDKGSVLRRNIREQREVLNSRIPRILRSSKRGTLRANASRLAKSGYTSFRNRSDLS